MVVLHSMLLGTFASPHAKSAEVHHDFGSTGVPMWDFLMCEWSGAVPSDVHPINVFHLRLPELCRGCGWQAMISIFEGRNINRGKDPEEANPSKVREVAAGMVP